MVNIIYEKDLASSKKFDVESLWPSKLKKYLGFIYNFKNSAEPESSGYIGQSGEGVCKWNLRLSKRPEQFTKVSSNFPYAGKKVNKKRRELPQKLWDFEVLAVVEADEQEELDDALDSFESKFILALDSVENGYNSNYGGKHGYKDKWKCFDTEMPSLYKLKYLGECLWKDIELSTNPEVYILPIKDIETFRLDYYNLDKIKTNFNSLSEQEKELITLSKDSRYIPRDKENLYLSKNHISRMWIFYRQNFRVYLKDTDETLGSIDFKVFPFDHYESLKNNKSCVSLARSVRLSGWWYGRDSCLYIEKVNNIYTINYFSSVREAADYTHRNYQTVLSASKKGLGGFLKVPNYYCRANIGEELVREYLRNY